MHWRTLRRGRQVRGDAAVLRPDPQRRIAEDGGLRCGQRSGRGLGEADHRTSFAIVSYRIVIGEEATARDPRLLGRVGTEEVVFVVDPIDGTKNFVSGVPLFGTMIACVARGQTIFSAIHDPVCASTAFAARGEGAWVAGPDGTKQTLGVSAVVDPCEMRAVAGANFMPEPMRSMFLRNSTKLGLSFWMRCCPHEYRMAAAGNCDLLVYNKLAPWDHLAGFLLHQEAGGYGAHLNGDPYRVGDLDGGLMCAPNREAWTAAHRMLFAEGQGAFA
ncbi:inositol monophosphatase [Bradyrhizobium sp. NC92]|uniref:inositol monophosphatase family protein n=1 Tax=Bradyrhizobium sp. (strain NC92) TaxID=55395 RepID=UPI0021A9D784|nr:inositol monophosphatase [Bradyrhizobium sp. NC92]UWU67732.1 inositol monophosphatase [Bradyrhizobium sp. NC92]